MTAGEIEKAKCDIEATADLLERTLETPYGTVRILPLGAFEFRNSTK